MTIKILEKFVIALSLVFLLKLHFSGQLSYLIHPRYFFLIYLSIVLIFLMLVFNPKDKYLRFDNHYLLLGLAFIFLLGSFVSFKPLSSYAQLQKALPATKSLDEFKRGKRLSQFSMNTKERELEDWVTVFSLDPEPKKYEGLEVDISGFYFLDSGGNPMVARYVISCCAADSHIIGLSLSEKLDIEVDSWIRVEGELEVIEYEDLRDLGIKLSTYKQIETPDNPYVIN